MQKMKGLFHIIEIVIISMVMFIMIFQMSYAPRAESDWGKSKLTVQGRDILYTMAEAGVDWSNENEVKGFIENAFNLTQVRYRIEILGIPKKLISVGCLCDGSIGCENFCDSLDNTFPPSGSLSFNGMPTDFTITQTDIISHIYDVIVTNQPLTGLETQIANYLNDNRGFLLARNLGGLDFEGYGDILNSYFAVEESPGTGGGTVEFNLNDLNERPDYSPISRYFSHIPNGTGDFYNITHVFEAFSDDIVKEPGIDGLMILETANGRPACVAKFWASNGQGRTAWLSGDTTSLDDKDIMMVSLVLWTSEHRRVIAGTDMNVEKTIVSMYMVPNDLSRADYLFQPMEAVLTLGYLY